MQPLDGTAFKSLVSWNGNLTIWQRENQGQPLGKQKLLESAWAALSVGVIQKRFTLTGLYDARRPENPVYKDVIKKSEFSDEDLHNYYEKKSGHLVGCSYEGTETRNVSSVIEK